MRTWVLAKTDNRSILGSLRDLRFLALVFLDEYPDASPEAIAAKLVGVPCGPQPVRMSLGGSTRR